MKNLHIIQVKYMSATNTKGSRVKLIDTRFGNSITLSYDYECNGVDEQAVKHLTDKGYIIIGKSYNEITGVYSIICDSVDNSFIKLTK